MDALLQDIDDQLHIRVYGTVAVELPAVEGRLGSVLEVAGHGAGKPVLIRVLGLGLGGIPSGCVQIDPFLVMVAGPGEAADCPEFSSADDVRVWVLRRDAVTVRLDSRSGTAEELILADAAPVELRIKGGLSASVKSSDANSVCIRYSANVRLEYRLRVFGGSWKKAASLSESGEECIQYDNCVSIVDSNNLTAKLCYEHSAHRVCLHVRAQFMGMSISEKLCASL